MGYHPRIECTKLASFQTTRARNSELWFVNNADLEQAILGYAARYMTRYQVIMYALAIEGNHAHLTCRFPKGNRSQFMRDFNSSVARAVARFQQNYPGGRLWARRYSSEFLGANEDIEEYFFYTVLQPVNDGLVDDIRDYPGYNCFEDAVMGREKKYKVINWKKYNDAKRWDPEISLDDFTEICTLKFTRLPGYEKLSQTDYASLMRKKLQERTAKILEARKQSGSVGTKRLRRVMPGSLPKRTKTSGRTDHRPRVLAKNPKRHAKLSSWYFSVQFRYRDCSKRYREGHPDVRFPKGTYKPPLFTTAFTGSVL